MKNIIWTQTAWKQYTEWQTTDKKTVKRINDLIRDILRKGLLSGIGKPEPLKQRKVFSRRIDDRNRLIYHSDADHNLIIFACKGHYEE